VGKRAAEVVLRERASMRGAPALSLRLPVIQGEADGHASRRLWAWLERMRDGGPVLLPEGGEQRVRFLYAADAARALVTLAAAQRWPDETALNLAQPDEPTLREFLEQVAAAAGLVPRFVPVSAGELGLAGLADTCAPYWGRWCSRPDPSRALELLGFRTRGVAEYLPSVVGAHLAEVPRESHPGYVHRARELELAARLASSGRR
jgi:nucleoside-diphosphate-sugar epimerase